MTTFLERYGQWAVVAGASEGLGLAFASALAARKLNVMLLARREDALKQAASTIRQAHGVETIALPCDLSSPSFSRELTLATRDLEVGIGVYNAAYSFIGETFARPLEDALRVVDVNCSAPLRFAHALVPKMIERKRGGLVLLSSLAAFQGSPRLAPYAASKAFNLVLAEGLWSELRDQGVDVIASCPGATRTPNYLKTTKNEAPGTLDSSVVAEQTLDALGGGPSVIPGTVNKLAAFFLAMLPRTSAVSIMRKSTANLEET